MAGRGLDTVDVHQGGSCDVSALGGDRSLPIEEPTPANPMSFRQHLRDPHYRRKLWRTLSLAGLFFTQGVTIGQEGPTLLDLQIITGTDLEQSSAFFTGNAIGYLIGALLCGAIFGKVNSKLFLILALCGLGLISIATPYCAIYVAMIIVRSLAGMCNSIINTAGNALNMRIWGNESNPYMQFLHFCFALGAIISPLYTEPFLAKKPNVKQGTESNFTAHLQNVSLNTTRGFPDGNFTTTETIASLPESTNVLYAFVITAVCTFVSAIPFCVLFLKARTKRRKSTSGGKVTQRNLPKPLFLFILSTMGTFFLLFFCVQKTFGHFLMTFLVNEFDFMTKSDGAFLTATLWASLAVSRFLMIFLAKLFSAVRLLYICCTLTAIAHLGFLISASFGAIDALAVFTAMVGVGQSGLFAAGFSWTESELLIVTGRVSSCFLVFASIGNITNPPLFGYLMEKVSNMWFCYLLFGLTLLMCLIFVFLLLFNRLYVNKQYGHISAVNPQISEVAFVQESEKSLNPPTTDYNGKDGP